MILLDVTLISMPSPAMQLTAGQARTSALVAQALMHLASDAVRAAAESPFLETAVGRASAVLCSLSLPPAPPDGALHLRFMRGW